MDAQIFEGGVGKDFYMKHLLLTTIAAVVLVGCGESQQSAPTAEVKPVEPVAEATKPEPLTVKAPDISIHEAASSGNIEAVKKHLTAGADVNAKNGGGTPLHFAALLGRKEIAEMLISKGATSPLASTLLAPNSTTAVCAIRSLAAPWPTPTKNATGASSPTLPRC